MTRIILASSAHDSEASSWSFLDGDGQTLRAAIPACCLGLIANGKLLDSRRYSNMYPVQSSGCRHKTFIDWMYIAFTILRSALHLRPHGYIVIVIVLESGRRRCLAGVRRENERFMREKKERNGRRRTTVRRRITRQLPSLEAKFPPHT